MFVKRAEDLGVYEKAVEVRSIGGNRHQPKEV
jgi:hypothetical protein